MPFGFKTIIEAIQNKLNIEPQIISDYFFNDKQAALPGLDENQIFEIENITNLLLEKFIIEFRLPFNAFHKEYPENSIDRLILSGGILKSEKIKEFIKKKIDIKTDIISFNKNIKFTDDNVKTKFDFTYNVAAGLCLNEFAGYEKKLNLITTTFVLIILILFVLLILIKINVDFNQKLLEDIQISKNKYSSEIENFKKKISNSNEIKLIAIINNIVSVMPNECSLSIIEYDNKNLNLTFTTNSYNSGFKLLKNLNSLNYSNKGNYYFRAVDDKNIELIIRLAF